MKVRYIIPAFAIAFTFAAAIASTAQAQFAPTTMPHLTFADEFDSGSDRAKVCIFNCKAKAKQ